MQDLYLIDASGYLFRAYFALPAMSNADGQATHAVFGFVRSILRLLKEHSPNHLAAVFDAERSKEARQKIYAEYKEHRREIPSDLPQQIDWAADYCELQGIPVIAVPGVEADDAIGTIATHFSKKGAHVYLCTSDKDLYQLVGPKVSVLHTFRDNLLIDADKVEELLGVRPEQIVDFLALMGDASDNIPGLPGFGPKTAAALLKEFGTLDRILANPEKVPGKKKQETLMADADTARLSQRLAMLDLHVDCPKSASFYERKTPDLDGLQHFFREMSFNSLLKEIVASKGAPKEEKLNYHIVEDERELDRLVKELSREKELCVDTETTNLRPLQAELVGIGLGRRESEAWYIPLNGKLSRDTVLKGLKVLLENPKIGVFGHNLKYDLHVLANCGIHVANPSFDTIVASYLLNSQSRRHSLDALALHYFEKVKTPIKSLIGSGRQEISMNDVPIEKVGPYCCEDVDYTIRLKSLFEPELKQRRLHKLMADIELPLIPILFEMERTGIHIDASYLSKLSREFSKQIASLEQEIYKLAGETFKLNSPKQLSRILFEKLGIKPLKKTTTGYSTAADVLEQLAQEHPIAEKVIEYRGLEKLRSTYVDTLPKELNPKTGRIHTTFVQYVAATGRLSCQDPNLQNIPIRTAEGRKIREAFCPDQPGWVYLSADYSQIELRLLAHLSQDPQLIRAFKEGQDIHAHTASVVFNTPLKAVTRAQRQQAKVVNFGVVYGQQAFGLSRELDINFAEAAEFIDTYFELYPKVHDYVEACKAKARKSGKAVTMLGRERLIPEINSRNSIQRNAAERLAINTPLQGSAADLIKLAMIRVAAALKTSKLKARILLQIHDELLFELPNNETKELTKLVKTAMEKAFDLSVALPVDISVGKNWKEC